jgi:peroxiredoxin
VLNLLKRHHFRVETVMVLLLLAVLSAACQHDSDEDQGAVSKVNVGDDVPAFALAGADGKDVSSASLNGKVYILNFFDTRCPDCRQEMEVLQRIYDKYHAFVPMINVPRSQTRDEVQGYWDEAGLSMPIYISRDETLYSRFATRGIPRTYVVDGRGKVFAAFSDAPIADYDTLDGILQQLVGDGNVRLSLRLKVAADYSSPADYHFHNEYTISRLEVWFFNADTKQYFTKAVIWDLTPEDAVYDTQYDVTYLYEDVRLRAGVYDIFAIANYEHGPDRVEDEMELLNMIDDITYSEGIEANIPESGPVMTSRATEQLAVDLVPWINRDYMLSMDLERVIAKLQIGISKNTFELKHDNTKYADINITNYKLVNLNSQYYLFQHKDNLHVFRSQPEFILPDNFSDYSDQGTEYVVDPLFYRKTTSYADITSFANLYQSWFGNFTTAGFASMPSADNYGFAYILENTAFKESQKNGYSPGIIFKAAVSPVFVYLYDEKQNTLKEEYRPEYWPQTIYLYNYNFYESIQAINLVSGLFLDELENYTDTQLKAYGIKQCKFNMGVYETYYAYWIHHRNSPTDNMGPMQYGIVRNNFYRIIVTGISGIGNSVISPDVMRNNHPNSYSDVTVEGNGL